MGVQTHIHYIAKKSPDPFNFKRFIEYLREILNEFFQKFGNIKNMFDFKCFQENLITRQLRDQQQIDEKYNTWDHTVK